MDIGKDVHPISVHCLYAFQLASSVSLKDVICRKKCFDQIYQNYLEYFKNYTFSGLGLKLNKLIKNPSIISEKLSAYRNRELSELISKAIDSFETEKGIGLKDSKDLVVSFFKKALESKDISCLVRKLLKKDIYTLNHSINVCIIALLIGEKSGIQDEELYILGVGALLHDVGKIKMPDNVLLKPGALTKDEFQVMKKHTRHGRKILQKYREIPFQAAEVACQHHERWNGGGYPQGLRNVKISRFSRICTVADIFDAITAARPYKAKRTKEEALGYLNDNISIVVDPETMSVFNELAKEQNY